MREDTSKAQIFELKSPELRVRISNYGARLLSFVHQGVDCLFGPKNAAELAEDDCYCGSICGRVANRIAGGCFELDGKRYSLAVNNGPNHLHGGLCGFSDRLWTVDAASETELSLSLVSPDGEEGYPGCVTVTACYRLEGNCLSLAMTAQTDAPTLLNLTNHAYWNLNGSGTVDRHLLQVLADAYTPMEANIPTGPVAPVDGTPFDLRRVTPLSGVFDDNYALPTAEGMKLAALLSNGLRSLRVQTDAPGMQVYTGDYLPLKRGGVALEAQNFPDSPHRSYFPSIVLLPGATYCRHISWTME